jgi:hypothetical protein
MRRISTNMLKVLSNTCTVLQWQILIQKPGLTEEGIVYLCDRLHHQIRASHCNLERNKKDRYYLGEGP